MKIFGVNSPFSFKILEEEECSSRPNNEPTRPNNNDEITINDRYTVSYRPNQSKLFFIYF